jgi:hypothetical protein
MAEQSVQGSIHSVFWELNPAVKTGVKLLDSMGDVKLTEAAPSPLPSER